MSALPATLRALSPQEKLAAIERLKASPRREFTEPERALLRAHKRKLAQEMLTERLLTQPRDEAIEQLVALGVDAADLEPVTT